MSKGARFDLLPSFHVYILRCADGSFHTGHTDNLEQRMQLHLEAPPHAYTSSRLPVRLAWTQEFPTRADELEAERQIKGWSRAKKEALIRSDLGDNQPARTHAWFSNAEPNHDDPRSRFASFDALRATGFWDGTFGSPVRARAGRPRFLGTDGHDNRG